jgi:hypothetical protein
VLVETEHRRAARLLVLDEEGRILPFRHRDPLDLRAREERR